MFRESRGDGTTAADEDAYQLIMRDKERLLSFDSKLKFIFSHSALREGWDNPNVFQICTLNETASVMKKRQEIGRGLRIAVNQDGERVHGFEVNRLTVMANESYHRFAEQLQKEIEQETGIRFGLVETHLFANIPVTDAQGNTAYLGTEASRALWNHLCSMGYIDSKGKVQDALKMALKQNAVELPEPFKAQAEQIQAVLRKVAGNLNIQNEDDRRPVKLNKAVFLSEDFKQLWERIKYRTTFRVDFDSEKLIETCATEIRDNLKVGKARFVTRTARIAIDRGGVAAQEISESVAVFDGRDYQLPDVVSYLQNETNLTRRSIVEIMIRSGRLTDFKNNPQKYIEQVAAIIKRQMRLFIVDGIKYQRIGDRDCYAQELFEQNELFGYLSKNMIASAKSVYDHVVYDSEVEEEFARSFEQSEEVKVYAKLPGWFKIDTPLGSYNPDWAVLVDMRRSAASVLRRRVQRQPVQRRPATDRAGQDRLRQGPLQGAGDRCAIRRRQQLCDVQRRADRLGDTRQPFCIEKGQTQQSIGAQLWWAAVLAVVQIAAHLVYGIDRAQQGRGVEVFRRQFVPLRVGDPDRHTRPRFVMGGPVAAPIVLSW